MKLPEINGQNYKKILRELDISAYPSLPDNLKEIRIKLIKKIALTTVEDLLTKGQFKKYCIDYNKEVNSYHVQSIDWNIFNHRPPKEFQKNGIEFLIKNDRAILADDMGCIDGNAIISCNLDKSNHFKITLSELYLRFNKLKKQTARWNDRPYYVSCLGDDNQFYLRPIEKIIYQGQKKVLKITLEDGKTLKATPDHEFNKCGEWVRLDKLKNGDAIFVIKKTVAKQIKILKIEDENEMIDVYDISVKEYHNFVANGIVVHNCGKTIQAIMASKLLPREYKILIITLDSLKFNFKNEILYFDKNIAIVDKKWITSKYTIVHYEQLKKFNEEIINEQFDIIIVDECHKIKHKTSARSVAFDNVIKKLKKEIKKLWLLTGTPIDNKPHELYRLLRIIKHPIADNWIKYIERYCDGYKDMWGRWNINGSSNLAELHSKVKGSILRRLKTDPEIKSELPDKVRRTIFVELKNTKGYNSALTKFKNKQDDWKDVDSIGFDTDLKAITKLMVWRQFCAIEKINDGTTIDLIKDKIEEGKKVIVFTNFTSVIDGIKLKFGKRCLVLDGRIKGGEERQRVVDEFNTNLDFDVIVINYIVGGIGYNIQSANVVIMNDLPWKPSDILQGEDRSYRLGQTEDVLVLYPIYKGTVEEAVFNVITKKVSMINLAIDGKVEEMFEGIVTQKEIKKEDVLADIFSEIDKMRIEF